MSSLKLYLLGSPRLERDGVPLKFRTRKNVALIAYLAMTPAPGSHTREALVTLLWPELEPGRARANLRRNLSMLKKKLGDEWLVVRGEDVGLDPVADLWFDVAQFRALLRAWQGHGHPETDLCPRCLDALAEAAALYRGDFLAGFSLRDSPAFDEWQFFQTEGLRQELASALERLVRGHSARGAFETAIPYARRWLALDPLHEPVHRHLMRLYAQAGQQAAALRQYQECARILQAELGLPPADETTALYEQIRSGPAEPEAAVQRAPLPPHNLPAQTTPFVGREEELVELEARLSEPACRLLTLIGPGGIGKTRLALQAAADLASQAQPQPEFIEDGVFFVSLAPLQSAEAIAPAVARALNFSFYEDAQGGAGTAPQQQLLDYLRPKSLLLILDNFEHLLSPPSFPSLSSPPMGGKEGGTELVSTLLRAAPGLKILATSRARLQVQGEHLFHVGGMRYPEPTPPLAEIPPDTAAYSAVQLFLQSARRVRSDFEPQADDWGHIAHICRLVQGMPLGILLAAGWAELLSPQEIAAEIGHSLDFLETDLRDVPERQRSLRAVFDHSWRLLTHREQAVFQGLSVFCGGFTRQAAQEVTGASLRDLMRLVNKSLLHPAAPERYEVHELLRQYAAEKLERAPAIRDAVRDLHSAYYAAALGRLEADLKGAGQQAAMGELDLEIENVRAAWDWAAERGHVEQLDQAMGSLALFFRWRSRHREGKATFRRTAQRLSAAISPPSASAGAEPVPSTPPALRDAALDRAKALRVLAKLWAWQSRLWGDERDHQLLQQSLTLLEGPELAGLDARWEKAFVLQQMGWLGTDAQQARQSCEASLALYEALGDRYGAAEVLDTLGTIARGRGAYDEARRLYEQGLALRRALGDQKGIARSLMWLSSVAQYRGQPEESARLARESIAISQAIGDQGGVASGLLDLSTTLLLLDRAAEAHSLLEQSPAVRHNLGFYSASSSVLLGLARAQLGRYEQAREQGRAALALAREIGHRPHIGRACWLLGYVALAEEAYAEARDLFQESAVYFRELGRGEELSWACTGLGYAHRGLGQLPQARQYLSDALQIFVEKGSSALTMAPLLALVAIALILADAEKERAVELYALASRYPFVANSRWVEDVAGKRIAALAATLPPDVLAAAQERGRARDLETTVVELLVELE